MNLHFVVDDPSVAAWCRSANRTVRSQVECPIRFEGMLCHQPHVTILLGRTDTLITTYRALTAVRQLACGLQPFDVQLGEPYLESRDRSFVFSDVKPPDHILHARQELGRALIDKKLLTKPTAITAPHVTLGYTRHPESLDLSSIEPPPAVLQLDRMRVSRAGALGTCRTTLRTYRLGHSNS